MVLNMWGWICSTCRVSALVSLGTELERLEKRENAKVEWKFTSRRRLIKSHHMPWASPVLELQMTKQHNHRDYKQQSSTEKSVTLAWSSLARWLRGWDVFNVLIFFLQINAAAAVCCAHDEENVVWRFSKTENWLEKTQVASSELQ